MSDYTPTTEEVRDHNNWLADEFDRWLFEMQEDAWDRGYQAGVVDFASSMTPNPYRQEETK